ncbi:MAG: hypothetical protein WB492_13655 [Christiangramia sp.]
MKSIISFLGLSLFLCLATTAQSDRYQMYVVHEDHIKDGMMDKHIQADKAILDAAKEHQMKGMDWLTFQSEDNRVLYLTPIDNFAELDKNPFEDLKNKMGDEAFEKLFEPYAETYTEHGDYILRLDSELSYMPDGMTQNTEGKNYRELIFYHIPPGKGDKAEEMAKEVKKLYSNKDSKVHYRLYKSGFGNMGQYYMVAVSATGPEEMENMRNENMQLIGEEGKKLFEEIDNITSKQEVVKGYIKPEISYLTGN